MKFFDGLRNFVTGLGVKGKDKTRNNEFFFQQLGRDQAESIYYGTWVGRKAIDIPAKDMTREWRSWNGDSEQVKKIKEVEKKFKIREKTKTAIIYSRWYGGGALLIGDGAEDTKLPLEIEKMQVDGLKYVHVFNRHEISVHEWDDDITSEYFGKPKIYCIQPEGGALESAFAYVHRSRLAIFNGQEVSQLFYRSNDGFGLSVLDAANDAIERNEHTQANIDALIAEAKIDVIKVPELMDYMSDAEAEATLKERFHLASYMKSSVGILLLGEDEDYSTKTQNFSNLDKIAYNNMQFVSGAVDIPITRFLGQSPAGLSSTGESDLRNYYDGVKADQTMWLSPSLGLLDEAIKRTAIGDSADEVDYEWRSLWQMKPEQIAEYNEKVSKMHDTYVKMNLFDPVGLGMAIRDDIIAKNIIPSLGNYIESEADIGDGTNDDI